MKHLAIHKSPLTDVFNQDFLGRAFQEFQPWFKGGNDWTHNFRPGSEIVKTEKGYTIKLSLAGVKKEDVKIETAGNTLTISGKRHSEHTEKEGAKIISSDFSYGEFSRSFTLNSELDAKNIAAKFEHGILQVEIPFAENAGTKVVEIL